jgi:hypothetical protein
VFGSGDVVPSSTGLATLIDFGVITLPAGMASGQITFGVNGVTASATGSGPGTGANSSAVIDLIANDVTTNTNLLGGGCVSSPAPSPCAGIPGGLPPLTLTVNSGDTIELAAHVAAQALLCCGGTSGSASITVDPLFLTLPAGATFDSGIPGFLSGQPPVSAPEPGSLLFLMSGLPALIWAARRRAGVSYR